MKKFPLPNDLFMIKEQTYKAVATVYYTDTVALVLLLAKKPPYFAVGNYDLETGEWLFLNTHFNIVPAVEEYVQSGGDY
jgi:hypothetical protein